VLVSDVARLSGTVDHEETGLVVPAGEFEAWRAAIARLASDPNRRQRWGRTAREAAEQRFSWPRVADRFEEILVREVERRRAADARERDEARQEARKRAEGAAIDAQGDDLAPSEG
jgi:alkylated DNA nucleotide flippase Atl1